MNKISLAKKLVLLFSVVFFASCDKEFNTIGSDIVGDDYFDFDKLSYEVKADDSLTGPVQSNNLKVNSLGVHTNGIFGTTISHFVTQVDLPGTAMNFGTNHEIDSVWVYVPYFSTQTGTDSEGRRTFELDSIYGDGNFDLKIYENGYYLGDYNPSNENSIQRHYSDERSKIETYKKGNDGTGNSIPNGTPLNASAITSENTQFFFNNEEKIIYKTNEAGHFVDASNEELDDQEDISSRVIKERFVPGMWINLDKEYMKKKILQASSTQIFNDNNFNEYFRGLYFKVTQNTTGAKAMVDFSKGFIRITYKADFDTDNKPETPLVRLDKTLQFGLAGNTINFFEGNFTRPVTGVGTDNDPKYRLYLKGGHGSVAYVDLFGADGPDEGDTPDELEALRANNYLINEANLTFYIDQDAMAFIEDEPNRIFVYDAKNKRPIVDYYADPSTNSSKPKYNKRGYSGIIEKDENGKGYRYKVRVTEYVKSLIKNVDSTNYRLGVAITEDINTATNAYLKPPSGENPSMIIPLSSVLSPLGTVLYSSNLPETHINYGKRLKLEIYYTKPD